jgi:geranylgeranyl reductase
MPNTYDVVIVGAGPAGLECARTLMDSRLSVLIIEKNEQIGPKTCAGGIVETVEPLHLPESRARSFDCLNIYLKEKRFQLKTRAPIRIIDRDELGHYQEQLISDGRNINILLKTSLRKIESQRVYTTAGEFGYRYLVGADGSASAVRRYLNLESRNMVGIYYNIDRLKADLVFYLDGALLKIGYIWEFPHQAFTNVGFYYNPSRCKTRKAIRLLKDYMERKFYPIDSKTYRAFPINHLYKGCQFKGNIFLTGDAAGLASSLTGEGIASAMISGREVARKIRNPDHDMKSLNVVIAHKQRQDSMNNVLEKLPFGLNMVYRLLLHGLKRQVLTWPAADLGIRG